MSEHPHFGHTRLGLPVHHRTLDHLPVHNAYARLNKAVAVKVTDWVGSMTCAYLFSLLALASLPAILAEAFHLHFFPSWLVSVGLIALVAWVAQTYIQLVLLSVIMVGQRVSAEAADARAEKEFADVETILDRLDLHTQGGLSDVLKAVQGHRDEVAMLAASVQAVLKARSETGSPPPAHPPAGGSAGTGRKRVM